MHDSYANIRAKRLERDIAFYKPATDHIPNTSSGICCYATSEHLYRKFWGKPGKIKKTLLRQMAALDFCNVIYLRSGALGHNNIPVKSGSLQTGHAMALAEFLPVNFAKGIMHHTRKYKQTFILATVMFALKFAICDNSIVIPQKINLTIPCTPIVIDGRLDDSGWQSAFATNGFCVFQKPDTHDSDTTIRLAADTEWLFIGFECIHSDPHSMRANTVKNNTGSVFNDECVKIFIFPGAKSPQYFRYVLNTRNIHDFTKNVNPSADWPIDPPWPSAVSIGESGWSAELAVPLAYLAAHGGVAPFRISAFRHKIQKQIEAEVVTGEIETIACWPAHAKKWIEYERLATITGIDPAQIHTPFMVSVTNTIVGRYRATATGLCYDIQLTLQALAGQTGTVAITILDQPASGAVVQTTQIVMCTGTTNLILPVTTTNADARNVAIILRNAANNAVLGQYTIADTSLLTMLRVYADRSYYTTEKAAHLVCAIGLDADELKGYKLTATHNSNQLANLENPAPQTILPLNIETLPYGNNRLTVALLNAAGHKLATQTLDIIKRAPKPGFEVKIDQEYRRILRDGTPYFPLGFLWDAPTAELQNLGFDTVATSGEIFHTADDLSKVSPLLADAAQFNVQVIMRTDTWGAHVPTLPTLERYLAPAEIEKTLYPTPNISDSLLMRKYWIRGNVFDKFSRQARTAIYRDYFEAVQPLIVNAMQTAATHSNLLAYMNIDEPGYADLRYFDILEICQKIYDLAYTIDGYRPVMCLFPSIIPNDKAALEIADIIITDPYWIPGRAGDNAINHISKIVALQERRCAPERKVCMVALLASWWSMTHKRALTHDEIICQTYLALIHGAKGLLFWRYNYVAHQEQWNAYSRLGREIPKLAPALLAPEVPQSIHYAPDQFDPDNDIFPAVQVRLFRAPSTGFLLLAANSKPYPVHTRFTVAGLSGRVRHLFSACELAVASNSFAETLAPLAVRVYHFEDLTPVAQADPVHYEISVATQPDKSGYQPEVIISSRGRPNKRNILINPSFEEHTLPLWPDYYRVGKITPPIGHPDAPWTLDDNAPYHGNWGLRLKNKINFRFYLAPQETAPATYIFSLYARTDKPNAELLITIGSKRHSMKITSRDWQRYAFPITVPANLDERTVAQIQLNTSDVTIWLDAMQFEKGREPTEFEP